MSKFCAYNHVVLAVIVSISVQSQCQRFLFSSAQGDTEFVDLKKAIGLNQTEYGILAGPAFSIFFALSNIIMGYFTDKYNRKWLLLISCAMFSLITLLTCYATKFWQILLLRLGLGIFESTIDLAGASLIADYFEPKNRNIALAIYGFGIYIGVSLSTAALALINYIGWRDTFLYVGIAGIANSLLVLIIKEPEKGRFDSISQLQGSSNFFVFLKQSIVESFKSPVMRWIIIACSIRISAGFCIGFYFVTYVTKEYPSYSDLFSYFQGLVVLICGMASAYSGGFFSNCFENRGIKGAKGYIPGLGVLVAIPFEILSWVIFNNIYMVLSFNAIAYLLAQNWTGPIFSMIVNVMPTDIRASSISIFLFCYTVISDIWVVLLGLVLDKVHSNHHPNRIGEWLAIFVCSLYLLSFPCFIKLGLNYARFSQKYTDFQELSEPQ